MCVRFSFFPFFLSFVCLFVCGLVHFLTIDWSEINWMILIGCSTHQPCWVKKKPFLCLAQNKTKENRILIHFHSLSPYLFFNHTQLLLLSISLYLCLLLTLPHTISSRESYIFIHLSFRASTCTTCFYSWIFRFFLILLTKLNFKYVPATTVFRKKKKKNEFRFIDDVCHIVFLSFFFFFFFFPFPTLYNSPLNKTRFSI